MLVALYNMCLYHCISNFANFYNISTFGFYSVAVGMHFVTS